MSLFLHEHGIEHERVFLDTGWEHRATYDYLRGPLTEKLGPITEISGPRKMAELVRHKGVFPSRLRRFCTQHLKVAPMIEYLDGRGDVVNAVGIRRDESKARSRMGWWEWSTGFDAETWRPILDWDEQDVIDIHHRHGLAPNPLYLLGAQRVGCWPCIYARKAEIRLIADIDPGRIDQIRELEADVAAVKRDRLNAKGEEVRVAPTWFSDRSAKDQTCRDCGGAGCSVCAGRGTRRYSLSLGIDKIVAWSSGGDQRELFAAPYSEQGCMRWGLCETDYMTHAVDKIVTPGREANTALKKAGR